MAINQSPTSSRIPLLSQAPSLSKTDVLLTLLPALLWFLLLRLRPIVINLQCANHPLQCVVDNIFFVDRLSSGVLIPGADSWSFLTQDITGGLALLVPMIFTCVQFFLGKMSKSDAPRRIGTDALLLIQTTLWNGMVTEFIRILVQRPRPFVYDSPETLGLNPAHYTSFISGHTSFTAAASTYLCLTLAGHGVKGRWLGLSIFLACIITFLTGFFRVLAGRHFITDVFFGAMSGALVATLIAVVHRPGSSLRITGPTRFV